MSQPHHGIVVLLAAALWFGASFGCVSGGKGWNELDPVRISQVMQGGDAPRRASLLLVDEGLASDALGRPEAALARYERALQVDATNPYAYLAIARHHVEARDSSRALQFLDHAESLLRVRGELPDEVRVHLLGLRGGALYDLGELPRGTELLDRARELAPTIWGDGSLQPEELR